MPLVYIFARNGCEGSVVAAVLLSSWVYFFNNS
jgi:hypothetical protein